jgi:signal transduction histidine kinase
VYGVDSTTTLPKGTENFEIDYTAPSFGAPERTQFRYRLVGIDRQWKGPVQRRQAFYTHIPPGRYKFELIASNENEGWSLNPKVTEIYIPPLWYQTIWFQLIESIAAVFLISIIIRSRIKRVSRLEKEKITVRTLERERIARNLHDTFFQSIQGLLLLVQYGTRQLPSEEPARKVLEDALEQSDSVMREGRELLLDLKADSEECPDLEGSLERVGSGFAKITQSKFELAIIGEPRKLSRTASNELCLLGREAIGNAFRHADATFITASLEYRPGWMQLVISDNGRGIPKNILKGGHRPGHWGLPAMKERARTLRARFDIRSESKVGTTVTVRVRSSVAYRTR